MKDKVHEKPKPENSQMSRSQRRKQQKLERKERKKNRPPWKKVLRFFSKSISAVIIIGFVGSGVCAAVVWHKYGDTVQSSVTDAFSIAEQVDKADFVQKPKTIIYDKNGDVLKELKQYDYDFPEYDEINPLFIKAVVAVEDKRFYVHHGVDLYGTLRSVASTVLGNDTQGGSTITQQLVRNVILEDRSVTIERKLKEQVISQEIEKKFSKKEILQYYLNNVYFGHSSYGIGPASRYYYGKDQSKLTIDEVAVIIGITNNPSLFDPVNKPNNALKKRNRVLKSMYLNGAITKAEYDEAIQKPIKLNIQEHDIDNRVNGNDALSFALNEATEDLMEKNGFVFQYTFESGKEYEDYQELYYEEYDKIRQEIVKGGYEIHTSIDPKLQKKLEATVQDEMKYYTGIDKNGIYKTQLAMTTIDNKTGEVLAVVGGRGQKEDYFNRAFQGVRQPGSAAKPLVAYANAFELGYKPQSVLVDSKIKNGPKNWYTGYRGSMTIRYALEQSVNTVAYKLANQVGSDTFLDKLEKMQFSHLTNQDDNVIISIGGFTKGVTTVEMAGGYSTFTRNGNFLEPTNIREIDDVVTHEPITKNEYEETKVFQEDAAYMMIDSLKSVMKSGTGKPAQPNNYKYIFGKTGTTNDSKDSYFVGASPYFTTAVWVGHDTPSSLTDNEVELSKELFREWNEELHIGKKVVDFKRPESVYGSSGGSLYSTLETYAEVQARREAKEDERINAETEAQRQRLEKEDYRIIYHLTSEEEQEREDATATAIREARNFDMTELDQYQDWMKLIEKAERLNERVKHQDAHDNFVSEINEVKVIAEVQKQNIEEEIEREKAEKKREEAKLKSMKEQLSAYMERVNAGELLSEDEFNELEQLAQNLENKGESVPTIDPNWLEPKKEEEEEPIENSEKTTTDKDNDSTISSKEESSKSDKEEQKDEKSPTKETSKTSESRAATAPKKTNNSTESSGTGGDDVTMTKPKSEPKSTTKAKPEKPPEQD